MRKGKPLFINQSTPDPAFFDISQRDEDIGYYVKAENLYKQFNVLYPLHMEKIDWLVWIEASAKAKLIREARRLLEEARMLFPGDQEFDDIETRVLHITEP